MQPRAVVEQLKEFGQTRADSDWDELDVETRTLIRGNLFAFLIVVAFDRGMPWQEAWRISTEIDRQGCLDPTLLASKGGPVRIAERNLCATPSPRTCLLSQRGPLRRAL